MACRKVVFRLKRIWVVDGKTVDLYKEIKDGRKRIEHRDASKYWLRRLCFKAARLVTATTRHKKDLTHFLKVHKAWLIFGFPKGNVPRFEVDITRLIHDPRASQLHIHFDNVKEVTCAQDRGD